MAKRGEKMLPRSSAASKYRPLSVLALILLVLASRSLVNARTSKLQSGPRTTQHTIHISKAGADDEDTVVDDQDTIDFCADPATPHLEFSIVFTTSPFESGKLNFDNRSCKHAEKAVLKAGDHARAFDYVLAVDKQYFDPHVIIMPGKGPHSK
jgi:hypothetical protein